jgi:predicted nucleotide-binding protein
MKQRFTGAAGMRNLVDALMQQRIVTGNEKLAHHLAERVEVLDVEPGETIIEQEDEATDIFFVLTGEFEICVNHKQVARRPERECVGEMSAINAQRRSATVRALVKSSVAKLPGQQFVELADQFPSVYRFMAKDLARRLLERNHLIPEVREKPRVFVICSTEALAVGRALVSAFDHDDIDMKLWTDGVFKVTNYTLEDLESELDRSDFAIAIAHPDDKVQWREEDWPAPRDNVVLELGIFMGRLGRKRAILMEPRGQKVKLPSDVAGITTISYKLADRADLDSALSPAVTKIRNHILDMGVLR